jgi:hypothetical protein
MTDPDDFRGGRPAPTPSTRTKTQAYMYLGDQLPPPESSRKHAVATTTEMPAVMTIQQLMSELVEVNVTAWKSLPKSVRDLMLSKPSRFHLDNNEKIGSVPDILYNHVVLKFIDSRWVLDDILE